MLEHLSDELQALLRERAKALAGEDTDHRDGIRDEDLDAMTLAILDLPPERYGVAIQDVLEIEPVKSVTPVPGLPEFWVGIVNLRGSMYAVIDLRRYLGLPSADAAAEQKIALVRANGIQVGLLVDGVEEIRRVRSDEIAAAPRLAPGIRAEAIRGVTADLLCVLDLNGLLADPALVVGADEEGKN